MKYIDDFNSTNTVTTSTKTISRDQKILPCTDILSYPQSIHDEIKGEELIIVTIVGTRGYNN